MLKLNSDILEKKTPIYGEQGAIAAMIQKINGGFSLIIGYQKLFIKNPIEELSLSLQIINSQLPRLNSACQIKGYRKNPIGAYETVYLDDIKLALESTYCVLNDNKENDPAIAMCNYLKLLLELIEHTNEYIIANNYMASQKPRNPTAQVTVSSDNKIKAISKPAATTPSVVDTLMSFFSGGTKNANKTGAKKEKKDPNEIELQSPIRPSETCTRP